ncbi:MAG: hypothetical protein QOD29_6186, partial [Alphaproteobacteria bacterium]|nr:hypothetical protein [Alphaproteobacteria bacterium]
VLCVVALLNLLIRMTPANAER